MHVVQDSSCEVSLEKLSFAKYYPICGHVLFLYLKLCLLNMYLYFKCALLQVIPTTNLSGTTVKQQDSTNGSSTKTMDHGRAQPSCECFSHPRNNDCLTQQVIEVNLTRPHDIELHSGTFIFLQTGLGTQLGTQDFHFYGKTM